MRPETRQQKAVLDAIAGIVAETGRAATLTEVAERLDKAPSTIHRHVQGLIRAGLLLEGRGLQPTDTRFGTGWVEGVAYLGREVERIMAEHHAPEAMEEDVRAAVEDAKKAAGRP